MQVMSAAATHVGRVRDQNEDRYFCGDTVYVVADGLGGHAAGEVASALAVEPFASLDGRQFRSAEEAAATLAEHVRAGNRSILEAAREDSAKSGMGTTLTAATVVDAALVLAHVGDSRAYLLRPGQPLARLTTDHTAAQQALDAGLISEAEAARIPERHMLARAVGLDADVEVDTLEGVRLQPGDVVLLCSDGLTEAVAERDIAATLSEVEDPADVAGRLVDAALAGGGPDNVTVVVVRVVGA